MKRIDVFALAAALCATIAAGCSAPPVAQSESTPAPAVNAQAESTPSPTAQTDSTPAPSAASGGTVTYFTWDYSDRKASTDAFIAGCRL